MHPWEDWAETWAHYMHMVDTLETAKAHGLTLRIPGKKNGKRVATDALAFKDYESLSTSWHAVTLALNDLNRSMGVKDVYPFIISPVVQDKLRFVHDLVHEGERSTARKPARAAGARRSLSSHLFGWLRPQAAARAARDTAAASVR
jgi:hypothetical protein